MKNGGRLSKVPAWLTGWLMALFLFWLLYWSWCWGWWGRDNLLLQYLFQCQCPRSSEQARFPVQAQVLVSACADQATKQSVLTTMLQSGFVGGFRFANEWWIARHGSDYLLIHSSEGSATIPSVVLPEGASLESSTVEQLRNASGVYWQSNLGVIVALAAGDSLRNPGNLVLAGPVGTPVATESFRNRIARELFKIGIESKQMFASETVIAPSQRFLYRGSLYLVEGNQRIVDSSEIGVRAFPKGWAADERGVLLEGTKAVYLRPAGFQVVIPTGPAIPQPNLLLRVPGEYMPVNVRSEMAAQMQHEQFVRMLGSVSVWISIGIVVVAFVLMIGLRQRGARPA